MKNERKETDARDGPIHMMFEGMQSRITQERAARHAEYPLQISKLGKAERKEAREAGAAMESQLQQAVYGAARAAGLEKAGANASRSRHYVALGEAPQMDRETESRLLELCRNAQESVVRAEEAQEGAIIAVLAFRETVERERLLAGAEPGKLPVSGSRLQMPAEADGGVGREMNGKLPVYPISSEELRKLGYSGEGLAEKIMGRAMHGNTREKRSASSASVQANLALEKVAQARDAVCALVRGCRHAMREGKIGREEYQKLVQKKPNLPKLPQRTLGIGSGGRPKMIPQGLC